MQASHMLHSPSLSLLSLFPAGAHNRIPGRDGRKIVVVKISRVGEKKYGVVSEKGEARETGGEKWRGEAERKGKLQDRKRSNRPPECASRKPQRG